MKHDELFILGNWKMNKSPKQSDEYIRHFLPKIKNSKRQIRLFVPYLDISGAIVLAAGSNLKIGAQNCHWETYGAYTGEVSADMLFEIGVRDLLLGHSERRKHFQESDKIVNKKLKKAVELGINSVLCVGESLSEREGGIYKESVSNQLETILHGIREEALNRILIAYEPIWAIGTGKTATTQEIEEMTLFIKEHIRDRYKSGQVVARVVYGGSITANNCGKFLSIKNIDGLLVGGASLDYNEFYTIVEAADTELDKRGCAE